MKRGDIFKADLDPVIGSEQGGTRPVLIVQNDRGNKTSPTVIVVPITSARKRALPTHAQLPDDTPGLSRPSTALAEQVRTIEKSRLSLYLGTLPHEAMRRVERALRIAMEEN